MENTGRNSGRSSSLFGYGAAEPHTQLTTERFRCHRRSEAQDRPLMFPWPYLVFMMSLDDQGWFRSQV